MADVYTDDQQGDNVASRNFVQHLSSSHPTNDKVE